MCGAFWIGLLFIGIATVVRITQRMDRRQRDWLANEQAKYEERMK
jgi:hypothetical protein